MRTSFVPAGIVAAALIVCLCAIGSSIACAGTAADEAATTGRAERWAHLAAGSMRNFRFAEAPAPLADVVFATPDGASRSLAAWRGKVVLVNFWATWCLPCREEMPQLERLQQRLRGDDFEVVAVSVDRPTVDVAGFLHKLDVRSLTLLLDREGRIVGRLQGSADWSTDDAILLIKAVILDQPR